MTNISHYRFLLLGDHQKVVEKSLLIKHRARVNGMSAKISLWTSWAAHQALEEVNGGDD
jgi:hypothetical protein